MRTLYNLDQQPAVISHDEPAVMPGESYDFTDEQIEAGLTGSWSDTDPREGLSDEQVFKKARDTSRADLDAEATALGLNPADFSSKQDVARAIQQALDAKAESIDDTNDPAAPEKE